MQVGVNPTLPLNPTLHRVLGGDIGSPRGICDWVEFGRQFGGRFLGAAKPDLAMTLGGLVN